MMNRPGSTVYLRRMAERCRRAALEKTGEEARDLVDLAQRCEERLADHARASELVASEAN